MVIIQEKEVYLLSTMKARFFELASEHGVHMSSNTFKTHLANAWDEESFIPQEGRSDLVCSAGVSVGDALKKAYKLRQGLQVIATDSEENPTTFNQASADGPSEDSTVHNSIGILRRRILANTTKLENECYSDEEMNIAT